MLMNEFANLYDEVLERIFPACDSLMSLAPSLQVKISLESSNIIPGPDGGKHLGIVGKNDCNLAECDCFIIEKVQGQKLILSGLQNIQGVDSKL